MPKGMVVQFGAGKTGSELTVVIRLSILIDSIWRFQGAAVSAGRTASSWNRWDYFIS
jgi:hypothetical protein